MRGKFITFEGFEGSGKSTHIKLLKDFLEKKGYRVLTLREPGSSVISEKIRSILLNKGNRSITKNAELMLYLAARAQIVDEIIRPALARGNIILCDRFHDATVAYQGYGLGIDRKLIDYMGKFVTGGIMPDLTVLLDIDVKKGLKRAGKDKDRIELRPLVYHRRVRRGYLYIAKAAPDRVKVVKVDKAIINTQMQVRDIVEGFLCRLKK